MAKRTHHVASGAVASAAGLGRDGNASDTAQNDLLPLETGHTANFVVFDLASGKFGFQLGDVGEIVRVPNMARMPLAPQSLVGLANLHGIVLPVVDLRRLLGLPGTQPDEAARVIVIARGAPVGYIVDRIDGLVSLPANRLEKDDAGAGSIDPNLLDGVIKGAEGESTVKILSPTRILRDEFSHLGVSGQRASGVPSVSAVNAAQAVTSENQKVSLVSFELGTQEYALPLDRVQEIIQLPDKISAVARSEAAVLGVVTLRDRLLPLVSLRALLGLPADSRCEEPGKVVVLPMGGGTIGVVADRTREIIHVDPETIDAAPSLLTRGEGDAEITSICRLNNGQRLVAILSPDRLFRSDLVRRVLSEQGQQSEATASHMEGDAMADEQFIIFRLGDQDYGLPIAAVDEIARPPERIARLPKAPAFVDGVMNLRGAAVPIIDLRRRFEIESKERSGSARILVLSAGGAKTGFMVDAVSEVVKIDEKNIRPAPEVSTEQMRLIGRVANLEALDRMILLVDPTQLLDRIEAEVLAKFDRKVASRESKAS
jgi:purine-binding chemotaxis protein CheW